MVRWDWCVETVQNGAVVHSVNRSVWTSPRQRTKWRYRETPPCTPEEDAFELLCLPADTIGAKRYVRATLIRSVRIVSQN